MIAEPDRALRRGGHVLFRAPALDRLRVAFGASDRSLVDRDARAGGVLRRALAAVAALDDDLVAAPALRIAIERAVRERRDQLVVVEVSALLGSSASLAWRSAA